MTGFDCPEFFNSAQRSAWRTYLAKYRHDPLAEKQEHWLQVGAEMYARYGIEFTPSEYREKPTAVRAALKVLGLLPENQP